MFESFKRQNAEEGEEQKAGIHILSNDDPGVVTQPPAEPPKRKRGRPRKNEVAATTEFSKGDTPAESVKGDVVDTLSTYDETNRMLKTAIGQADQLMCELKDELDKVRTSRTLKGRCQYISDYTGAIGQMLNVKVQAIRELNNSIRTSNDLDYKKMKDTQQTVGNDAQIQALYSTFVSNPNTQGNMGRQMLGPSMQDMTIRDGVVASSGFNDTSGYQQFRDNMSPEVHRIIMERDPNVQEVVCYDQNTGRKWFDVINVATGQPVPNMPHMDDMFLEDTTIDVQNGIARNTNLNKSWRLIVYGQDNINEY